MVFRNERRLVRDQGDCIFDLNGRSHPMCCHVEKDLPSPFLASFIGATQAIERERSKFPGRRHERRFPLGVSSRLLMRYSAQ